MKFKFDQIEIDLKIKKTPAVVKTYAAAINSDVRMHKASASAAR